MLAANGVGPIHFGISQRAAIERLAQVLGRPGNSSPLYDPGCGVTGQTTWLTLIAFFDHRRFVGFSYSGTEMTTAHGLRVGDTTKQAHKLYGSSFTTSAENGGTWQIQTAQGLIGGFLKNVPAPGRRDTITTIEAGHVGCPATSPGNV